MYPFRSAEQNASHYVGSTGKGLNLAKSWRAVNLCKSADTTRGLKAVNSNARRTPVYRKRK